MDPGRAENVRDVAPKHEISTFDFTPLGPVIIRYEARIDEAVAMRLAGNLYAAPSGCWVWTAKANRTGYGCMTIGGRLFATHRVAWMLAHGEPVPEGLHIDHRCRNKRCANPEHLEAVLPVTNMERVDGHRMVRRREATHCVNGHPFNEENTYQPPGEPGIRRCRACARKRLREFHAKAKAS